MALLTDPEGATFAIWQAKNHAGAGIANEPGALTWAELNSKDPGKNQTFYTQLLGWTTQPMPDEDYTLFMADNKPSCGMLKIRESAGNIPPSWTPYFQVTDCAQTVQKAVDEKAKLLVKPTFSENAGTFALLQDPLGAAFGIIQPK